MTKAKGDPHGMVARCKAALEVASTWQRKDRLVSGEPMAETLGMTWRNLLETYIKKDAGFPIIKRGSQGVDYQFDVVKVLKHMIMRSEKLIAEQDKAARKIARLTGIVVAAPEHGGPTSAAEMRQTLALLGETQKLKQDQSELVPRALVDQFMRDYHDVVVDTIRGEAVRLDPTGTWPTELRQAFDDDMTSLLVKLQERLGAFIESPNGHSPSQPGGTGRRAGSARGR